MASLLTGTLVLAGAHTMLWLPRSFKAMRERRRKHKEEPHQDLVFQRFQPHQRRLHILVVISFLGLALTGMTLKFSYLPWAQWLSDAMGGFETAGYVHRLCAVITFFYFGAHLYFVVKEKRQSKRSWMEQLLGKDSILFNKNDLTEAAATLKWFVGAGPRPQYGHWTYWEKFDYFSVFWGVAVIGSTGLMLWFPEFFTLFLPGWFINVATIIHSDEALLAVAFIFTVHFFNTHFRPDRFPMDTVIFTGRMTIEELKEDRPREYAELLRTRKLKKHLVPPMPKPIVRLMRAFGATALVIGIGIIMLIVYAELFGYR
jgi:thiosulfate reductase cytochrome b subunit